MALTREIWRPALGPIEDLHVPRDREGHFQTQVFDRYNRDIPHIAEGLTHMFVAGVSTQKGGEVAETLTGVAPSASTVSRLNHTLTQQFEVWGERRLQGHWRILYLDGAYFTARHGDQTDSTVELPALAVDLEGNKEVLADAVLVLRKAKMVGVACSKMCVSVGPRRLT
jgi:putative transposase